MHIFVASLGYWMMDDVSSNSLDRCFEFAFYSKGHSGFGIGFSFWIVFRCFDLAICNLRLQVPGARCHCMNPHTQVYSTR